MGGGYVRYILSIFKCHLLPTTSFSQYLENAGRRENVKMTGLRFATQFSSTHGSSRSMTSATLCPARRQLRTNLSCAINRRDTRNINAGICRLGKCVSPAARTSSGRAYGLNQVRVFIHFPFSYTFPWSFIPNIYLYQGDINFYIISQIHFCIIISFVKSSFISQVDLNLSTIDNIGTLSYPTYRPTYHPTLANCQCIASFISLYSSNTGLRQRQLLSVNYFVPNLVIVRVYCLFTL